MQHEFWRAGDTWGEGRAASLTACRLAREATGLGISELEARYDVPHKLRSLFGGHATLRRAARWLLCAMALTMLTGCLMVGPDFLSPPPPAVGGFLPDKRESVPGAAVIRGAQIAARWWDVFRSRNLNRLIQDGIENNPDLQAAEAAVRVAQANAYALRGTLFPVISATFDASRQMTPGATLTSNVPSGADTYSLHTPQVTVAFVPDVFGGTRRAIESADAVTEQQSFQREAVYVTLASNIALAAIQEASLRGQIAATRRLIDIQTQLLYILRRQNDRGQIALPDVVAQEIPRGRAGAPAVAAAGAPACATTQPACDADRTLRRRRRVHHVRAFVIRASAETAGQPAGGPGSPTPRYPRGRG